MVVCVVNNGDPSVGIAETLAEFHAAETGAQHDDVVHFILRHGII
jgi:hypothetical protein